MCVSDVPEVRARCALDGSLVLTCSVQSEDNVLIRWVGPDVPANQSMTPGLELTLYLPSMKENITCEVDSKLRLAHSQPPLLDCRGTAHTVLSTLECVHLADACSCSDVQGGVG